ncbi:hypothetical protein [[Limnothrix rosea] IAM M-220]|uniref:hypothetical protein n=1 Tax=[Limnothrix rosea] IAM M-220 TaxID=454133 RepID=UPI00095945F6|nr:hypothetical protein [[Limnothrix rosea] IAM M-220]OKH17096.1 hypothetical protein NIES208_10925 [[Limnothrix rosea] IAM M-220]
MISAKSNDKLPELQLPTRPTGWPKFGAIAVLMTAGSSIFVGLWLGLLLLLDPNSILWLNRFLPAWSHVPIALSNPLQNLAEIEAELQEKQLSLGAPLYLGDEMIVPVWQRVQDCTTTQCEAITALRVYFTEGDVTGEKRYSLLSEVRLGTAALNNFSEFKLLPREGDNNYWLSLEGTNVTSDLTTGDRYGVLLHYDPYEKQLVNLLTWQSAAGNSPRWEQAIASRELEFVVDQSRNLEPEFEIFRVEQSHSAPILLPVNLEKAALDLPVYQEAIKLAELKLWAIAQRQLVEIKQTLKPSQWTEAAENQFQLIAYHSKRATEKCESTTLNVGQTINHCLRAGDVNEALRLLQNNFDDPLVVSTVVAFLEASGNDLQGRLEALRSLDPFREAVTIWQFLSLTAQDGSQAAIAAIKTNQKIDDKLQGKIETTLKNVETALSQQTRALSADSKLMGQVRPARRIQPSQWLQPESEAIALDQNRDWHILDVSRFFDGQQWQQAPFTIDVSNFVPGQSLWQTLGLDQNATINVGSADMHQPTSQPFGQVRAAKFRNGKLQLLVEGMQKNRTGSNFAFSQTTLRWLTPNTLSLRDLAAIEPAWVDLILMNLWRHLRASNLRSENTPPSLSTLKAELGAWQVSPVELTGNNHAEARIQIYLDAKGKLATPSVMAANEGLTAYNLIFSDTGDLLYSELDDPNITPLKAIADLQDGGTAALVFRDQNNQITLKRWDSTRRIFNEL